MSAEVKLVKEEIKIINEGLTLKELGLIPPDYLVEELGWDSSTKINKLYKSPDNRFSKSLFTDVIGNAFFDFALAIIKTADRPDKLGFDPNFPVIVYHQPSTPAEIIKTPNPFSPLQWVVEKHSEENYDGLHQVVDALFSRGALLCPDQFKKYYESKGIHTIACNDCDRFRYKEQRQCKHEGRDPLWKIIKGRNGFLHNSDRADIDDYMKTTKMMHRIFAEYWMQSECMIKDDATINTVEKFKEKLNKEMPIGVRVELPKQLIGIIFSYISPHILELDVETNRPKLRRSLEKYYIAFRKERDAEFKTKMEKIREDEKLEDERRQKLKEAKAMPQVHQVPIEEKTHNEMVRIMTQDMNVEFEIEQEPAIQKKTTVEKETSFKAEMASLRTEVMSLRSEMNALRSEMIGLRGTIMPLALQFSALIQGFGTLNKTLQNPGSSESRVVKPS